MSHTPDRQGPAYGPLYFLAALGAGGLVVTFFLYLMFWVPHPGRPVPIFEDIYAAFVAGGLPLKAAILVAWAGIAVFTVLMIRMLVWNLRELGAFKRSAAYGTLRAGNAETQLMAAPLTLAMFVNMGFILGLVYVPGLWGVVEYLFPLALLAFLAIGVYALRIYGAFLARVLTQGGFDCAKNNSFAQTLPAFAFSMVGVGLAAPAAMSGTATVAALSLIASTFFIVLALVIGGVTMILGLRSMMENGANEEAAPTLLIAIPLLTVVGIAWMRQSHGLHVHFGSHTDASTLFSLILPILTLQIIVGLFGLTVLRAQGYFARFVNGEELSAGSYALVCPGVALSVMMQFFVNKGLVGMGVIDKFSVSYWAVTALALILQFATIWLVLRLNRKHFARDAMPATLATA